MRRRDFLKGVVALAAADCIIPKISDYSAEETEIQKSNQEIINFLEKKYKIEIKVLEGMTLKRENEILETLKREIIKYPPAMFQPNKSKPEFGIILKNEALGAIVCSATPYDIDRDGKVDYNLLRIQPQFQLLHQKLLGSDDEQIANALHHELVHIFENKFINNQMKDRWDKLNVNGYSGWSEIKGWLDAIGILPPSDGFLNYRAQAEGEEDRAVTGSYIMRRCIPQNPDKILKMKIKMMEKQYCQWSNGLMDDRYWEDLEGGRVDTNYWSNH